MRKQFLQLECEQKISLHLNTKTLTFDKKTNLELRIKRIKEEKCTATRY